MFPSKSSTHNIVPQIKRVLVSSGSPCSIYMQIFFSPIPSLGGVYLKNIIQMAFSKKDFEGFSQRKYPLVQKSRHKFLPTKKLKPAKIFSRSRLCAESSFLFSALLPGAAQPDCFACHQPAGDPGRAHRWSKHQGWLPSACPLFPCWSHAQAAKSSVLYHTDLSPPFYTLSQHRWRWHWRDLCSLEIVLDEALFSYFFPTSITPHCYYSVPGLWGEGPCASAHMW